MIWSVFFVLLLICCFWCLTHGGASPSPVSLLSPSLGSAALCTAVTFLSQWLFKVHFPKKESFQRSGERGPRKRDKMLEKSKQICLDLSSISVYDDYNPAEPCVQVQIHLFTHYDHPAPGTLEVTLEK